MSLPTAMVDRGMHYIFPEHTIGMRWLHGTMLRGFNNCSCDLHPAVVSIGFLDLKICNLPLLGSWLLAVLIGLMAATFIHRLGPFVTGSLSYSITFFTYAVMITSGFVVHCLYLVECGQGSPNVVFEDVAKLDLSLTTCIALSFFFNGLIDIRIMSERHFSSFALMAFTYVWVFFTYFGGLAPAQKVYFSSILIGCGTYLICQLLRMAIQRSLKGSLYLLVGGVVGGASLMSVRYFACWFCHLLGPWSVQGIWYYGSDLAMFFIFLYVWYTREKPQQCFKKLPIPTDTRPVAHSSKMIV